MAPWQDTPAWEGESSCIIGGSEDVWCSQSEIHTLWKQLGTDPFAEEGDSAALPEEHSRSATCLCKPLRVHCHIWDRKEKDSPPTNILHWISDNSKSCRRVNICFEYRDFVPWGQVESHYLCLQWQGQQAAELGAGAVVSYTSAPRKGICCLQVHSKVRIYNNNSRVWSGHWVKEVTANTVFLLMICLRALIGVCNRVIHPTNFCTHIIFLVSEMENVWLFDLKALGLTLVLTVLLVVPELWVFQV